MKLIKVYSNKPFKNVRFNPGFNVILGEPKERKDSTKDTHNLGKSLLITVLDFLLLKNLNKDHIFSKHSRIFQDYVFFLEIKLNSGKFLVIRREILNRTKISFRFNTAELESFERNLDWDQENIPISKARVILNNLLELEPVPEWPYRKSISYFLRTQKDFLDVFQLAKYDKGKHRDWKPFLFELLGFDGKPLLEKYELEEKKKALETLVKEVQGNLTINTGEVDRLKGIIEIKTEEKKEIEKKIDDFKFYTQDKEINQKLVDEIDLKISTLNTIRYNVTEEINRIEKSLELSIPRIDIDELKHLYEEVKIFFPNNLVQEYKNLEDFNRQVSEERKKYMEERLIELKEELHPLEAELQQLDGVKSELLSVLKDKDSYGKFKHYQKMLVKVESEIARYEEKMEYLGRIWELELQIGKLSDEIKTHTEAIKLMINRSNNSYKEIRSIFSHIIHAVLNVPALLSLKPNIEGNIEFHADIQNPENMEITAEAYGTTYKKLLCMAFDLSVLITYSNRSFYKFVYHDGALEGMDNRKKENFLEVVREICHKYGLQYILTVIDSDIPRDYLDKTVGFSYEEIVLRLHDRDDTGRLFETSF